MLRILLRAIRTTLRCGSLGAAGEAQLGAVTFHEAMHLSADDVQRLEFVRDGRSDTARFTWSRRADP